MHFLFQKKKKKKTGTLTPEGVNSTNRAETEAHREEKQFLTWRRLLHFSFCMYTVTLQCNEYLFISFCVYLDLQESACVCVCVTCLIYCTLVSLLHRADFWLAWQEITSQSNKNLAALTPIWHQFTDQQQQCGRTHTHSTDTPRTTWKPHWSRCGWLLFVCVLAPTMLCFLFRTSKAFFFSPADFTAYDVCSTFQASLVCVYPSWPRWTRSLSIMPAVYSRVRRLVLVRSFSKLTQQIRKKYLISRFQ